MYAFAALTSARMNFIDHSIITSITRIHFAFIEHSYVLLSYWSSDFHFVRYRNYFCTTIFVRNIYLWYISGIPNIPQIVLQIWFEYECECYVCTMYLQRMCIQNGAIAKRYAWLERASFRSRSRVCRPRRPWELQRAASDANCRKYVRILRTNFCWHVRACVCRIEWNIRGGEYYY